MLVQSWGVPPEAWRELLLPQVGGYHPQGLGKGSGIQGIPPQGHIKPGSVGLGAFLPNAGPRSPLASFGANLTPGFRGVRVAWGLTPGLRVKHSKTEGKTMFLPVPNAGGIL